MENLALIVEFQVIPECLDRFNTLLADNARSSIADESGCLQFDIMRANDDPCRIVLYEIYLDQAALAEHISASHTKSFLAAAKTLTSKQTVQRLTRVQAGQKAQA